MEKIKGQLIKDDRAKKKPSNDTLWNVPGWLGENWQVLLWCGDRNLRGKTGGFS